MDSKPDRMDDVLALASECDPTQLELSASEGFLLSRIDGATPWRLLREIGGIPADEVDVCLGGWLEAGWIVRVGESGTRTTARESVKASAATDAPPAQSDAASELPIDAAAAIDESALDEDLDLDLEAQRRILQYDASLDRPYHVLLGVRPGAEPKVVKRAYFKLSKEFHPDRYFRKDVGSYGERLERIFKKILEAHEILSDPKLCQVENQPTASGSPSALDAAEDAGRTRDPNATTATDAARVPPSSGAGTGRKRAKKRPPTKLERLRQRMPFKINHAAIAERRARADEIFRAAQTSQQAGRLQEAEANIRIAISFDPGRAEFKEALGSLRIAAAGARASKLLEKPSDRMSDSELYEALRLLEDVLPYRPHDPELNERAARVSLRLGKLDDASEYVETLLHRSPESPTAHTLAGRIHKERGELGKAVSAFERALKYDEDDVEARRSLAAVRIGQRDSARGGMS